VEGSAVRVRLHRGQRRRILGLLLLWPVSVAFWTAQSQIWNVYKVWLRDHVRMVVGGFDVPVPWMQSLDGLAPAVLIPLSLVLWALMARRGREPDEFGKLIFGLLLFGAAVAMLGLGPLLAGGDGRAPILLPVLFHVVSNVAWVWFGPVMLAVYATRAPAGWRGTLIGFNTLSISAASLISGRMGSLYERVSPREFWLTNAAICFSAGVFLLSARGFYTRVLARGNAEGEDPLPAKEQIATDSQSILLRLPRAMA